MAQEILDLESKLESKFEQKFELLRLEYFDKISTLEAKIHRLENTQVCENEQNGK